MRIKGDFEYHHLRSYGIHFYYLPHNKFKTESLKCVLPLQLSENASFNALLPFVLYRGTKKLPQTIDLIRSLDYLYGTGLFVDVSKKGEWQTIEFALEMLAPRFLPPQEKVLLKAITILKDMIFEPHLKENSFASEYVSSEKRTLLEDIKGLKNEKDQYALERCISEMYYQEPFGIYKYGSYQSLSSIDANALYKHYQQVITETPLLIFYGGAQLEQVLSALKKLFPKRNQVEKLRPVTSNLKQSTLKVIVEQDKISQGQLMIGYHSPINRKSPFYAALIVFNGIFGGFPHSKLFRHVREEKGLAYSIYSQVEASKGFLNVAAGIAEENFHQTITIINHQLEAIQKGNFTVEELNYTKNSLISQLHLSLDSPFALINRGLVGVLNNQIFSNQELIELISAIKKDDIIKVALSLTQDTIYFLKPCAAQS